jgi:hypothetical protein
MTQEDTLMSSKRGFFALPPMYTRGEKIDCRAMMKAKFLRLCSKGTSCLIMSQHSPFSKEEEMNERTHHQARTAHEIEKIVTLLRLHFYNRGEQCGAKIIQHHMKELKVKPLPLVTTIGRILTRRGLTQGRTGIYQEDFTYETHN